METLSNEKLTELKSKYIGRQILIRDIKGSDIDNEHYCGKSGVVERIDDLGYMHGTWGGIGILCGTDDFEILKTLEGKKFYLMRNVGKAKYVVNYHNGERVHSDRSPFYDMRIFKNKIETEKFMNELRSQGYTER